MNEPIYGKDFRIDDLTREPGKPHLIINAKVAKKSEDGWRTDYVKQEVAIPSDEVAPADVTELTVQAANGNAILAWTNPAHAD